MAEPTYSLPENLRIYAIGDVHGHLDALERMHDSIATDLARDEYPGQVHIVYLGDYVDRGPDSKGVIEYLISRRDRRDGIGKSFLKGNHEAAIFDFLKDPNSTEWLKYGGLETLRSYGVDLPDIPVPGEVEWAAQVFARVMPPAHLAFLKSLELSVSFGDYLFAHAGVDPTKPLSAQTEQDLTMSRQPFLSWYKDPLYQPLEKKVVHGHSISKEPIIRPHRIGVDTGLYEGGALTSLVLQGAEARFLQVCSD